MEENTIPFVVKLKEYIDQRNSKISEKNALIEDLGSQLQSKNTKISELEAEYKQTFDDAVFEKLVQYKKDADSIQDSINKTSQIINLMGKAQFEYDSDNIEKEINSYITKIKFKDLKQSVVTAKENYLKAIENYTDKLNEVYSLRRSMDSMRDYIPKETRDYIIKVLSNCSEELHYTDDMLIKAYDYDDLPRKLNRAAIDIYLRSVGGYGL